MPFYLVEAVCKQYPGLTKEDLGLSAPTPGEAVRIATKNHPLRKPTWHVELVTADERGIWDTQTVLEPIHPSRISH